MKSLVIGQSFGNSTVVWSGQGMREPVCETGHEPVLAAEEAAGIWSAWARSLSLQRVFCLVLIGAQSQVV